MVEGASLESLYTGNCIASSNLAVSASKIFLNHKLNFKPVLKRILRWLWQQGKTVAML